MKNASHILAQAVAQVAGDLPPGKRADLYDAVGTLSQDPEIAESAKTTAQAIREAESAQLLFSKILSEKI